MSDYTIIKTEYGNIQVETYAIGSMIIKIVDDFHGKIHLTNKKGRRVAWMNRITDAAEIDNMHISFDDGGNLEIRIYVMIRFGLSISQMTSDLLDRIDESCEKELGYKPVQTTVVVTGLLSRNVARRNIIVSRSHERRTDS